MPIWRIPDNGMARIDAALFELAANQAAVFIVAKRPHVPGPQSHRGTCAQRRRDLPAEETAAASGADLVPGAGQPRHSIDEIDGVLADPNDIAVAHTCPNS
jgi:hypothetical protein